MPITIKLLAHASFQIKTDKENIYIDPSTKNTGLKKDHFEPANLILVSHKHDDHCDKKLVKHIRNMGFPPATIIAPSNCKDELKKCGTVWDLDAGQFMQINSDRLVISAVNAYNVTRFRKPGEPFHPKGFGVGFILKIDGVRIYFAGDTDLIPEMDHLGEIDVALLPCGDTYTMDMAEAAEAAILINPTIAIPMHIKGGDTSVFKSEVESKSDTKVVILGEGEEYTIE
ncbi:MAG: MBL fold metallo-hydrolase [Candidatus Thorarchaeota archaeon]